MPDSLLVELGFRIPVISGIPDSLRFITDSKAHDSRFHKSNFPHSGFPYMGQTLGIGALFSGGSRGGAGGGGLPPLFVDQTEARRAEKFFFREPPSLDPALLVCQSIDRLIFLKEAYETWKIYTSS